MARELNDLKITQKEMKIISKIFQEIAVNQTGILETLS